MTTSTGYELQWERTSMALVTASAPTTLPPAQQPNLTPVKAAFAAALAALLLRWGAVKTAWVAQLAAQVTRAAQDDDVRAFAELGVDPTQGAAVLADAMTAYAPTAAQHVVDEAKAQGVTIPPQVPDSTVMAQQALVTAELLRWPWRSRPATKRSACTVPAVRPMTPRRTCASTSTA